MNALGRTWTSVQVNQLRSKIFPTNNHRVGTLNDLEGRFLTSRTSTGERRPRRAERPNAAARNRPVFVADSPTIVQHLDKPLSLSGSSTGSRSQRRQSPVRRIHYLRRAQTGHRYFEPVTISPERVVSVRSF